MRLELNRVAPLRAANVVGILYLILFGAFALAFLPFVSLVPADPNLDPERQASVRQAFRWMLLSYPLLGGVSGWVFALLGAAIYNLVAPRIGGFVLELGETSSPAPRSSA